MNTTTLLLTVAAADLWRSRRLAVRRTVVAALVDGTAVHGVLWARTSRHLIIRGGTVHSEGQQTPADGDIIIDRNMVLYLQALHRPLEE